MCDRGKGLGNRGRKGHRKQLGHDRGENGRARASRGVSASVGVCAGVKEYEIVNLLKKQSAVWGREPCVCAVVYLWVETRIIY